VETNKLFTSGLNCYGVVLQASPSAQPVEFGCICGNRPSGRYSSRCGS